MMTPELKLKQLTYQIENTNNSLKQLASQEKDLLAKLLELSQLKELKNGYHNG